MTLHGSLGVVKRPFETLQICILDGNKYAGRCREEGEQSWDILRECMVLRNQRREPLLTSSQCANDYETPQVCTYHSSTRRAQYFV